jgi:ATP-dependent Clp endopeptidase proteolytic subunit ClpP
MIFNKISENKAELNINDEIGFWGITHQDFTNQLNEVGDKDIQLNIASYGGAVTDAFAIYNSLKAHKGRVTANIYGDSASSATFIAMAADEIKIAENVMFLIHNVWGGVTGEADDLRKAADDMDKVNANIIDVYKKRTGLNKAKIKSLMNDGDWLTAKEAKANKLVDKIVEPSDIFNRTEATLLNCANAEMKEALLNKVNQLNNNKNQIEMNEETKGFLATLKEDIMNAIKPTEVETPVVEETKEETFSKEDVETVLNSVKDEVSNLKESNEAIVNSKDEEIANLKAELEKANNKKTEVKANGKSPEVDAPEVVEENNPIVNLTIERLKNKYSSILKFK